jgi:hypothetical protein
MAPLGGVGESIGLNQRKRAKKESSRFEEPRCKPGSNSRIQFASNESKLGPRNLDPGPHLKWPYNSAMSANMIYHPNTEGDQQGPKGLFARVRTSNLPGSSPFVLFY